MINASGLKEYYLYVGTIFAHQEPYIVNTVLGSCISVCLWDVDLRIGGINHYQLALWNGDGLATPKYGNIAINKLLAKMIKLGSNKKKLVAKIFGGASVLQNSNGSMNIGKRNILLAEELLDELGIPIMASDVGGNQGRKMKFNTESGDVFIKKINHRN